MCQEAASQDRKIFFRSPYRATRTSIILIISAVFLAALAKVMATRPASTSCTCAPGLL
jgi:hypothetical protein